MATVTHGGTLPNSADKADFYAIIDNATVINITNADISNSANIANSKLNLASISQTVSMNSRPINEAQGGDIASATTTDIGAATGNFVKVTGTTTITGLGTVQAGTRRIVQFTGILTLTHNGTSLILPGSANITTASGDTATFVSLGSGNWKCVQYQRVDGTSVVGVNAINIPGSIFRNLVATPGGDTSQWTVTADELIVQDVSGNSARITSFNKTLDIDNTNTAGGTTNGAKAANTIYHVWAIRKSSDGTTNLVAASTTQTLSDILVVVLNSYDQGALVSVIGTNNSSAIIPAKQVGSHYEFSLGALLASGATAGYPAWIALDLTPANMTTVPGFVPSTLSNLAFGTFHSENNVFITNDNSVDTSNTTATPNRVGSSGSPVYVDGYWKYLIKTSDTIYWESDNSDNAIYLSGFKLNKLT